MNWNDLYRDPKHWLKYPSEPVVRWLSGKPKGTFLDVGCGGGRHVLVALERQMDVHACDVSENAVSHVMNLSMAPRVACAPMTELPYVEEFFDYILSWAALEYSESEDALARGLAEIHRVLKPGGEALISLRGDQDSRQQEPNPDDGDMPVQFCSNGQVRLLMREWAEVDFGRQILTQHGRTSDAWVLTARR